MNTADRPPSADTDAAHRRVRLGCIADDFTGATDLANNLVRAGMRVVQTIGVPTGPIEAAVDAVVVALKSRTIAPPEAVAPPLPGVAEPPVPEPVAGPPEQPSPPTNNSAISLLRRAIAEATLRGALANRAVTA